LIEQIKGDFKNAREDGELFLEGGWKDGIFKKG
jgi:hypothetical protein